MTYLSKTKTGPLIFPTQPTNFSQKLKLINCYHTLPNYVTTTIEKSKKYCYVKNFEAELEIEHLFEKFPLIYEKYYEEVDLKMCELGVGKFYKNCLLPILPDFIKNLLVLLDSQTSEHTSQILLFLIKKLKLDHSLAAAAFLRQLILNDACKNILKILRRDFCYEINESSFTSYLTTTINLTRTYLKLIKFDPTQIPMFNFLKIEIIEIFQKILKNVDNLILQFYCLKIINEIFKFLPKKDKNKFVEMFGLIRRFGRERFFEGEVHTFMSESQIESDDMDELIKNYHNRRYLY